MENSTKLEVESEEGKRVCQMESTLRKITNKGVRIIRVSRNPRAQFRYGLGGKVIHLASFDYIFVERVNGKTMIQLRFIGRKL